MLFHRLFAGLALSTGPERIRQQRERAREREEAERKQREGEERRAENVRATYEARDRARDAAASAEELWLQALEDKYAEQIAQGWRPEVFRSTKGLIDAWGKPASQDMIDLHERLKARDNGQNS